MLTGHSAAWLSAHTWATWGSGPFLRQEQYNPGRAGDQVPIAGKFPHKLQQGQRQYAHLPSPQICAILSSTPALNAGFNAGLYSQRWR